MCNQIEKVVVVGGSGGLGLAMVQAILDRHAGAEVTATYHTSKPAYERDRLHWQSLDIRDKAAIKEFSGGFTQVDWVINAVGFLHNQEKGPEKSIRSFDADLMLESIQINTLPTLLLAQHFAMAFKQSPSPLLATISARVGSIEDNRLGGWYSYRISKAALNMALKTLSIEWKHSHRKGCVVALHPGTNNTPLSEPFQASVPTGDLLDPADTAEKILNLLDKMDPSDSGKFWTWEGNTLPW